MIMVRISGPDTHAGREAKSGILFKDFFLKVREDLLPLKSTENNINVWASDSLEAVDI